MFKPSPSAPLARSASSHGVDQDRRNKLIELLILRVQEKFMKKGYPRLTANQFAFVQGTIDDLVSSKHSAPTELDLAKVVAAIPNDGQTKKEPLGLSQAGDQRLAAPQLALHNNNNADAAKGMQQQNFPPGPGSVASTGATASGGKKAKDPWAAITEKDLSRYQDEQRKMQERVLNNKKFLRDELDRQVAEKQTRQQESKRGDFRYAEFEKQQVVEWKKVEDAKKEEAKRKDEEIKRILDEQLRLVQQKRLAEKERERQDAENELRRIHADISLEHSKEARKRVQKKEEFAKFIEYNAKIQDLKAQQKMAESDLEKKMQAEYTARLEAQERARQETYAKTYERQKRFMALNATTVQGAAAARQQADEERASRQQQEMYQRMDAVEADRRQRRMREKQQMLETLELQKKIKHQQKSQEKEEDLEMGQKLRQIGLAEEQKKQSEMLRKKELQKKNFEELRRQVDLVHRMRIEDAMTETEKKLNRQLLGNDFDANNNNNTDQDLTNVSF